MNSDESSNEVEQAAAVAATSFAITSLESHHVNQHDTSGITRTSLTKIKSKILEIAGTMAELGESIRSAGKQEAKDTEKYEHFDSRNAEKNEPIPETINHPVPSIEKTPTMLKKRLSFADHKLPEDSTIPSIGRTPTQVIQQSPKYDDEFSENERIRPLRGTPTSGEQLADAKAMKPDNSTSKSVLPSPIPPPTTPSVTNFRQGRDAETWEREEMARIKHKFEKLNATILEWEDKKRMKAKHKLEIAERAPMMRAKAMQEYQIAMEQIKQIADVARAEAKERRRNEELEAKEKANMYRTTGEPPPSAAYHCF